MSELSLPASLLRGTPLAARILFGMLSRGFPHGSIEIVGPDGSRLAFPGRAPGPHAHLALSDWGVISELLRRGDIGFAETYMAGRWHTDDLTALLTFAATNADALEQAHHGRWWSVLAYRLRHLLRANTRTGSRRNIHAHYDLGNAFYSLWLDRTMTYSSALYEGDETRDLPAAQTAKYERILRMLDPQPGAHILEVGCGWGGFAEYAARTRDCRITGITISAAQLEYAQARIERAGLADRVELKMCDYRDLQGTYDGIVSIEMFEAVGERYWPGYFDMLRERLVPGGRAVVQTITIDDTRFDRYRSGTDFIQQYIFPGGMLPSPSRFVFESERAGLSVAQRLMFGVDYARTLAEWHERFNARETEVRALGFDDRFLRLWRFYLAYCEAGFRAGSIDVMHAALVRN